MSFLIICILFLIQADACRISQQNGQRTRYDTRVEDGGHTQFHRFRLRFAEAEADGNKIGTHLRIDGKEGRQRILRRYMTQADFNAQKGAPQPEQ